MSLGAYTTDWYYDPLRPKWLPHYIDTPSENFLKWGFYPNVTTLQPLPDPPRVQPPGAPVTQEQMKGNWNVDQAIATGHANSLKKWKEFFAGIDDAEQSRQNENDKTAWLWLFGAGVVAIAIAVMRK